MNLFTFSTHRNSSAITGKKHRMIRGKCGKGKRDKLHNYYIETVKCHSLRRFPPFPEE